MLPASKSRIDKAGRVLAAPLVDLTEEYLELEEIFEKYRESHLKPLTNLTSYIQTTLNNNGLEYYIAQRLKRKPQILRKLNRLSVRLTQLQDIGGFRIIADNNRAVDNISNLFDESIELLDGYQLIRTTDYRPLGRDDSGYRALHKVIKFEDIFFELQLRSRAQHYWAESIERTSVFYGKRLKEGEGSITVLGYFKDLSWVFGVIERGARASAESLANLERLRLQAEHLIREDGHSYLMDGFVNEGVIKTMLQKEKANPGQFNNWILVFDWNTASFVTWEIADRSVEAAVAQYVRYEKEFPEDRLYEVVLVGSSDIQTVQKTHSHYFGISKPDKILEDLGQSVRSFADDQELDIGAKKIISCLTRRKIWGENHGIQKSTLQNHFCKDVYFFDECLSILIKNEIVVDKGGSGVTLNISKKDEIEKLM